MMQNDAGVTGGVDTHRDQHVAAVIDAVGRMLGTRSFAADQRGYEQLVEWLRSFGDIDRVGVEGTGAYGAGLTRHLLAHHLTVVEVDRPNRQLRRHRGKDDPTDAEAAARAALNGQATGVPKARNGLVEAIRAVRVERRSAVKARTQASNQIRDLVLTAPEWLRSRLLDVPTDERVEICARFRVGMPTDPPSAMKAALRVLALRYQHLSDELAQLDEALRTLCAEANPALLSVRGVGPETAATLLVAAGDNPDRMRSEAAFAALCGVSPVAASSGRIRRYRLNQGGNRQANHALWRVAMVRRTCDPRTKAYVSRRRAEGKTDREIMRCLKRYIAREIYQHLTKPRTVPSGPTLRTIRVHAGITLATAADHLATWPIHISRIERGIVYDAEFASRYQNWLRTRTTTMD